MTKITPKLLARFKPSSLEVPHHNLELKTASLMAQDGYHTLSIADKGLAVNYSI